MVSSSLVIKFFTWELRNVIDTDFNGLDTLYDAILLPFKYAKKIYKHQNQFISLVTRV